ncbi:MAG: hypothetical protein NVV66_00270 [Cellulomonas sp.]|uniref:hypothetical protein n=1 Tax=Cellulomonas sp. TaxID=40001 RepID=UPI00258587B2|nr:hypothetical protein [Cellulomonas sp.]MCR6703187.1 hypothetical protein [Cellulomonas sp.]
MLGAASGLAVLSATGVAWPTAQFVAGVMVLAALVTLVGLRPARTRRRARRPVRILRVP